LEAFQKKLAGMTVLDPACGSGNFLYVSLQMLLDLEKELVTYGTQLGFKLAPQVSVQQLRAIEINPYAFELAQVSVQIGFLQWRRDNGFDNDRSPVLQNLDGFQNEDALLVPHFRSKARTLKEAQAGEHAGDDALKFYTEREWPKCDVIVGNPPFLGDKKMRRELGHNYVEELRAVYSKRIPNQADLCCYWLEKARELLEYRECKRAGLLATQGIRGGANREVLKRIKDTGDIFFAESDRPWILDGANVHVSMVGFDTGQETEKQLDGKAVAGISPQLTASEDFQEVAPLAENDGIASVGVALHGSFDLTDHKALEMLAASGNPHGRPNSDVLRATLNAFDIVRRPEKKWVISFAPESTEAANAPYALPFGYALAVVKPERQKNNRKTYRDYWWIHGEARPTMLKAIGKVCRYLAICQTAKHHIGVWLPSIILPAQTLIVFAREDDYFFGVMLSAFHRVWALKQGTRLETRPRYTPTTCFETFPFPFADDLSLAPPAPQKLKSETGSGWESTIENRFLTVREEPPAYGGSARGVHAASTSELQATVKRPEGRAPSTPAEHRAAIAAAARELNELRERWLNPPEWTEIRTLEFPGSVNGPWSRYVDPKTVDAKTGVGTVRYPRLEPRDADCAAKLKKRTLTNLYNERPAWLDLAHKKLDAAVAAAYGWPADLSDEQILERLLALNLERAAEEAKAAKVKQPRTQRTKTADELV
jgi:type II restriction/modification system DNA methylase subunit YeeA